MTPSFSGTLFVEQMFPELSAEVKKLREASARLEVTREGADTFLSVWTYEKSNPLKYILVAKLRLRFEQASMFVRALGIAADIGEPDENKELSS